MFRRVVTSFGVAVAFAVTALGTATLAGQAQTADAKKVTPAKSGAAGATTKFVPKRLPWGDADISGNYTTKDEANTPFERPEQFAGKRLEDVTPAELAAANEVRRRQALAQAPYPGGGSQTRGVAIAVPIHWFDSLDSQNTQAWFVTDPPDGHIPPLTDEAKKRQAAQQAARVASGRGTADSYTDRSTGDRCIAWSIGAARILPTLYGNSVQIIQTKDYVAIRYEMVHETRLIPIEGRAAARPHNSSALRSYYGDAIARWEGDTLVVDTTNYSPKLGFRGSSDTLHTIERFTRVGPNKLYFTATFDDPHTWTQPWTFGLPWTEDDTQGIFEYACHEGNYGLRNILSAGRSDDKKGIKSSNNVDAQSDLGDFEP
jgi:hypothetical protein